MQRAVELLASLLAHVAGTVTAAFARHADRRAAYDFLANKAITLRALTTAIADAAARRCRAFKWVYVPVDGSSLTLRDPYHTRGTGTVGSLLQRSRGFLVMSALAISPEGVPLGLCGQHFWTRPNRKVRTPHAKRALSKKESGLWVRVARCVVKTFVREAPGCTPWFQFDRGGDIGDVLAIAVAEGWRLTVRAAYDRRLAEGVTTRFLWQKMLGQRVLGRYTLDVPARPGRTGRRATMSVRACQVTLRLKHQWTKKIRTVTIGAVLTREIYAPKGEQPLEWLLLTTAPLETFADARAVIDGYAQRWTIEQFHQTWKSGRCDVEETQLHAGDRILKWATMLSSVAVQTLHLMQQSRATPQAPASTELSRDQIDAVILLRQPHGYAVGADPPLGLAVRWIAEIGGFTNKSKATLPGKIVIGRGLERIEGAAIVLGAMRKTEKTGVKARRGQR